jgi:hypothetical protein
MYYKPSGVDLVTAAKYETKYEIGAARRRWQMKALLSFFLFTLAVDLVYLASYLTVTQPTESGKVPVESGVEYGFGAKKRLLTFQVDPSAIDLSDKIFSILTVKDDGLETNYTVGIEIKGSGLSERPKLNYAFEMWTALNETASQCVSVETCDDDKEALFDFGEKYEDWVLRGAYGEQVFVRDALAGALQGGILENELVEVVFDTPTGLTYEGVYLLIPAIQRRVLEKRLDWDEKGKAKCDELETSSLIGEFTIEGRNGRKAPCSEAGISTLQTKFRYPKCDMEACFHPLANEYFSILTGTNTSEVRLNFQSFSDMYFAQKLLQQAAFGFASTYFYVDPDARELHAGPRWDYDDRSWMVMHNTWNLFDFNHHDRSITDVWPLLFKNPSFIARLDSNRTSTVTSNGAAAQALTAERLIQHTTGYFDNNIARWGMFGERAFARMYDIFLAVYDSEVVSKNSFAAELAAVEADFAARTLWMTDNSIQVVSIEKIDHIAMIVGNLIIPVLLTGGFVIAAVYVAFFKKGQPLVRGRYIHGRQ